MSGKNTSSETAAVETLAQGQRVGTARSDQDLEALIARQISDDANVMGIVFDHKQDRIARLDFKAVVGDLLDNAIGGRRRQQRRGGSPASGLRSQAA